MSEKLEKNRGKLEKGEKRENQKNYFWLFSVMSCHTVNNTPRFIGFHGLMVSIVPKYLNNSCIEKKRKKEKCVGLILQLMLS